MFFDILIIAIVAACAAFGFRSGFLISLSRIGGWVGALLVAFFYYKDVEAWTVAHTDWFERTGERILKICQAFVDQYGGGAEGSLPSEFGKFLDRAGSAFATEAASRITQHVYTILVFLGIILGIKLVLFVLTLFLSKKFHKGFIGGVDSFVGLLFGLFQSIIAILVVFALIMPLSYTISVNAYVFVQREMDNSVVAQIIYENNPMLDFIEGFIPTELHPERWLEGDQREYVMRNS